MGNWGEKTLLTTQLVGVITPLIAGDRAHPVLDLAFFQ